ncbi:VWA domain-containing protein [Gluconobacter cerevisiae]|uniref:VWA domain-containing protein n=1 Tax=Gluconobacter cerevisiae TaxID=1379734 RepID=A0ABR9YD46_9PROT|nr:VWA domain-containing protein [Gluconobacter cerevisiae]MBF0876582.1 VWA domain-containing protein [Gluconobacter cerevisiae]
MMFDLSPMLPIWLLATLAALSVAGAIYGALRGARGMIWRALAVLALLGWLSGPRALHPVLRPVPQDALLVVDRSASMQVGPRTAIADQTARQIMQDAAHLPGLTLHRVDVPGGMGHGTRLFEALDHADLPQGRFAGAIVVTDGMDHDVPAHLPARFQGPDGQKLPLHLLLTARGEEQDRRLRILSTPPYAIVGQNATLRVQVDDLGAPDAADAVLTIRSGDAPSQTRPIRTGTPQDITVPVQHPGETLVGLSVSPLAGEASTENNSDVVRIRGVRDRLRVLLVSGVPNQGERVWRRLLKADPSVDLVHFTILRSPNTDDGTPLSDLALIPFPIRELFQEKIRSFDLIILDGFRNSNILPDEYLTNIADYVRNGGGLLVTAGPEFTQDGTLQDTSLAQILPAHVGTDGVATRAFRPALTDLGKTHPVTAGLTQDWGPWYRALRPDQSHGEDLMHGPDGAPLLLLDRVNRGRVAMLMSDQLWLWSRGEGGGGPQAELLRRLSHWLMKEPDLEENRLTARIENGQLDVERHAAGQTVSPEAFVTAPDGKRTPVTLKQTDGVWHATLAATTPGIWSVRQDGLVAFASPVSHDPVERQDLRATATVMGASAQASGGTVAWVAEHTPRLKQVSVGSAMSGSDWMGLPVTTAAVAGETRTTDLVPAWGALLATLIFLAMGWWREGH